MWFKFPPNREICLEDIGQFLDLYTADAINIHVYEVFFIFKGQLIDHKCILVLEHQITMIDMHCTWTVLLLQWR